MTSNINTFNNINALQTYQGKRNAALPAARPEPHQKRLCIDLNPTARTIKPTVSLNAKRDINSPTSLQRAKLIKAMRKVQQSSLFRKKEGNTHAQFGRPFQYSPSDRERERERERESRAPLATQKPIAPPQTLNPLNVTPKELFDTFYEEDTANFRSLINSGVDPNVKNEYNYTLLQVAVLLELPNVVETILNSPYIDVNQRGSQEKTALHLAATLGHEAIIKMLLEKNPNTSLLSISNAAPVDEALENGHYEAAELITGRRYEKGAYEALRDLQRVFDITDTQIPLTSRFESTQASLVTTLKAFRETLTEEHLDRFDSIVFEPFSNPVELNDTTDVSGLYKELHNRGGLYHADDKSVIRLPFSLTDHHMESLLLLVNGAPRITFIDRGGILGKPVKTYEIANSSTSVSNALKTIINWNDLSLLSIDRSAIKSDLKSSKDFYRASSSSSVTYADDLKVKPYKTGICTYANPKTTIRVLLRKAFGNLQGDQYYKQLTTLSRANTAKSSLGKPSNGSTYSAEEVARKFPRLSQEDAAKVANKVNSALEKRSQLN